jgi:uncharacterized delta-60 repeat protein
MDIMKKILFILLIVNFIYIAQSIASFSAQIQSLALQSDGKIVAAGWGRINAKMQIVLSRYLSNGSIDIAFGNTGKGYNITLVGSESQALGVAIQTDGKILVTGYANLNGVSQIIVVRYTTAGIKDSTFGINGVASVSVGIAAGANALVIQPDGSIVVAGAAIINNVTQLLVARFLSNGTLDSSFGVSGIVTTTVPGATQATANAVVLQTNNKIVISGFALLSGVNNFLVARYNADGTIDNSFGTNGITTMTIGSNAQAQSVGLQSDGKIIVIGFSDLQTAIARYDQNGILDTSFGASGITKTSSSGNQSVSAMAGVVESDNTILAAGYAVPSLETNDLHQFFLAHYTATGILDPAFGANGIALTDIGTTAEAYAIALQNDGKIVLGGFAKRFINFFALARYNSDGSLDTSFGIRGIVGLTLPAGTTGATGPTGPMGMTGSTGPQGNTGGPAPASNFLFAYDTTTQSITTPDVFQNVTFNTIRITNGWNYDAGTAQFMCNQTGMYNVNYQGLADNTSDSAGSLMSMIALQNSDEVPGSQSVIAFGSVTGMQLPLTRTFLIACSGSDLLQLQVAGSSTNNQLTAGGGTGITRPSATLSISKL